MTARLLQISGVVVDLLYTVEAVPRAGQEAIVHDFAITPGGGFNAMVAARRAGMGVSYGGGLGSGPFAQIVEAALETEGVEALQAPDKTRDQGCCTVMIDSEGERTFVAREGAEGYVTHDALARLDPHRFDYALLSGYALHYAGARDALCDWLKSDAPIPALVFDPSPVVAALPRAALDAAMARAQWISANAQEAAELTGINSPEGAANALACDRPKGGAVVRDGARGCVLATAGACEHVPGHPVRAVDTNGAGDAHIGSFLARLAAGDSPLQAVRYANIAAALSTTQHGPATAPEPRLVWAAMKETEAISKT